MEARRFPRIPLGLALLAAFQRKMQHDQDPPAFPQRGYRRGPGQVPPKLPSKSVQRRPLRSLRSTLGESLAGGTRSRAPPSLHSGVAITVPRSGAFLTGLATAVGPASRRVPRRRYADAPAAALSAGLSTGGCSPLMLRPSVDSRLRELRRRRLVGTLIDQEIADRLLDEGTDFPFFPERLSGPVRGIRGRQQFRSHIRTIIVRIVRHPGDDLEDRFQHQLVDILLAM